MGYAALHTWAAPLASYIERSTSLAMKHLLALALAVTFAACTAETPPPQQPPAEEQTVDANALTATGWGPLRIGMTMAEITTALGPDANPNAVGGPDPESCNQFRPERAPEGMLLMV